MPTPPPSQPNPPERRIAIDTPSDMETGVYANFVAIWHDSETFTLDFATITRPPKPTEDTKSGEIYLHTPARVVSRVKIPPSQVFEIMKALEQQLSNWERETGRRDSKE